MKIHYAVAISIISLFSSSGEVSAQTSGWSAKAGYNHFFPQVRSGQITGVPGSKVDVEGAGGLFGSAIYSFDNQISAELAFGVPPRLDITGDGSVSAAGKIAETKILAPVMLIQYRFAPGANVRPYVGIGTTYAKFRDVRTTLILSMLMNPGGTVSAQIDSKWGMVAQAGIAYELNERWFLDASVVPMRLKTTARLSTGQSVNVSVNPVAVNLSLGYRF